jgi:hypothetical protein
MKVWKPVIIGAVGLSVGSSVVNKLPANAATAGIQKGFGAAAGALPIMVNVGMAGYMVNQLKGLGRI